MVLGGEVLGREVHVTSRGLRRGVPHELAQHQEINAGGGQLGAVGVAKPVRPHPQGALSGSVITKGAAIPGFAKRSPSRRTVQDDETFSGSGEPRYDAQGAGRRPARRRKAHPRARSSLDHPCPPPGVNGGPGPRHRAGGGEPHPPGAHQTPWRARWPGPGASRGRKGTRSPRSGRPPRAGDAAVGQASAATRSTGTEVAQNTPDLGRRPWPRPGQGTGLSSRLPASTWCLKKGVGSCHPSIHRGRRRAP